MSKSKRFVYILKSIPNPDEYYVGLTSDPDARLQTHNAGLSPHTAWHQPWRTLVRIEFDDEAPAVKFERYLKTGSGREFATAFSNPVWRKPSFADWLEASGCGLHSFRIPGRPQIHGFLWVAGC